MQLIFSHDMILHANFIAYWQSSKAQKQQQIIYDNHR